MTSPVPTRRRQDPDRARRRRRRRRQRRTGYALYALAGVLVIVALVGLIRLDRGDPESDDVVGALTTAAPQGATATSTVPGFAVTTLAPLPPGFLDSGVTTVPGAVPVNTPPILRAPSIFDVAARGPTLVEGIFVEDAQARTESGDLGILLYTEHGTMEFAATDGVVFHVPNGSAWIPITGSLDAINTTLASLHYVPGRSGPHTIQAVVSDFGHDGRYPALLDTRFISLRLH